MSNKLLPYHISIATAGSILHRITIIIALLDFIQNRKAYDHKNLLQLKST